MRQHADTCSNHALQSSVIAPCNPASKQMLFHGSSVHGNKPLKHSTLTGLPNDQCPLNNCFASNMRSPHTFLLVVLDVVSREMAVGLARLSDQFTLAHLHKQLFVFQFIRVFDLPQPLFRFLQLLFLILLLVLPLLKKEDPRSEIYRKDSRQFWECNAIMSKCFRQEFLCWST